MEYRLIRKEDVRAVFLLGKSYFASKSEYSWDWSIQKIAQYLKKSFGLGIICLDRKAIVGFVLVERNYSSQKPNVAWLTYIMIDKRYRHKHIASDMLELAVSKLKKIGKTDLITDVYMNNASSLDFFRSNKFKIKEKWAILSRTL